MNPDTTAASSPNKTFRVVILDPDVFNGQRIRTQLEQDQVFRVDAVVTPDLDGVQAVQLAAPDVVLLVAKDDHVDSLNVLAPVRAVAPAARRVILGVAESMDGAHSSWIATDWRLCVDRVGHSFVPALRRLLEGASPQYREAALP